MSRFFLPLIRSTELAIILIILVIRAFPLRHFLKNYTTNFDETLQTLKDILTVVLEQCHQIPFTNKKVACERQAMQRVCIIVT